MGLSIFDADKNLDTNNLRMNEQSLRHWLKQPLGCHLLEIERIRLEQVLPNLFGYHILQVGCLAEENFLESSRISHKILLQLQEDSESECNAALICSSESLSVASDSLDVVVMPHILEFTLNPHKMLREVERVLIGEGHLVIIGFNPWSLWGTWRLLLAWRDKPPWNGHFYGLTRIKDWLTLLDFEILTTEKFFFRPPFKKMKLMYKLKLLENLGKYCWPFFGGAYMIVAKKRVIPLTPTKMRWHARRRMISSGVAEPSARSHNRTL